MSRQRFLNAIFGDGKVSELLSWKNKTSSAVTLAVFTAIWFLFQVLECNFLVLLSHLLLLIMFLIFLWTKFTIMAKWNPPNIHEFEISESIFRDLFDSFKWSLLKFIQISYGDDFKLFVLGIIILWLLSVIGNLVSSLNLVYFGFVCLQILPILYERFEEEIDQVVAKTNSLLNNFFNNLNSNVLSKIPWGRLKQHDQ